jgi:hypothetical protein
MRPQGSHLRSGSGAVHIGAPSARIDRDRVCDCVKVPSRLQLMGRSALSSALRLEEVPLRAQA